MKTLSKALLASVACASVLAGCATNGQGQLVVDPRVNATITTALMPAPAPAVVVEEAYQPVPTDIYVANVAERDVFISGGNTYFWVVGPDGVRHRHFYARGDHRADVFHRRDELHRVMANHQGHLPDHAIAGHPQMAGPGAHGGPAPSMAAHGQPRPGAAPMMPVAHAAPPARPAPAARPSKDPKKS
ncbi:hypothetical protein [Paraburkholderia metrosideri]|uniref:hypothetical protein n=1 Tax=Paraburkholderia metrosideri TaxID=580937 RepID=UPI001F15F9C9|nr:hypothetical protein [Paraburkholderia metrosideri]